MTVTDIAGYIGNERFPVELGWKRKSEVVSLEDIISVTTMIGKAANLITNSSSAQGARRRDLHAGMEL